MIEPKTTERELHILSGHVLRLADEFYATNALTIARFETAVAWTDGPRTAVEQLETVQEAHERFVEGIQTNLETWQS